jgi:alpha-D-xyloside xylohydrolase
MQDFGEQVQSDMVFADGSTGAAMHNRYPVLFHRTTREIVERWSRERAERPRIHFYTRSGYTGAPAWEEANFPGDETTDWSRSAGIASLTTNMLNRGVGGAYGFSTDIGGYFDIGPYRPTTKELLLRWAEWAALSPYFRLHGSIQAGTHMPWNYDEETVQLYAAQSRLHLAARPLILSLWREAVRTGVPVARPLWLEFPGDARAAREDQQWMLGPDVLVAPVIVEGARTREVYFPEGCWRHPETGARYNGGQAPRIAAPLGELPYFFRCGTRPFAAVASGGSTLPRRCSSRRAFRIRLRRDLVAARVYVNARRVRTLRGRRLRAFVDLRGLPRGRFTVRVVGRTRLGRTVVRQRRYRTCVPRRR